MRIALVLLVSTMLLGGCLPQPKVDQGVATTAAVQKANLDIQPQIVTETEFHRIYYRMDRVPLPEGGYMYRLLSSTGGSALSYAAKPAEPTPTKK